MSELKTILATPSVLTLTGAAAAANCSTAELLSFGADGRIEIYVDLPSDLIVFDVDHNTLRLAEDPLSEWQRDTLKGLLVGYGPLEMRGVKGLLLSKLDCKAIAQHGDGLHGQSIFSEAWKLDPLRSFISVCPSLNKKASIASSGKPSVFGRFFATYAKSQLREVLNPEGTAKPEPIAVCAEKLRVFSTDLQRFLNSDFVQEKAKLNSVSAATTINTNSKATRSRTEHDVIREAIRRVEPFTDAGKVWAALVQMASSNPPYPGTVSYHPRRGGRSCWRFWKHIPHTEVAR